jgi:hypothetical protein
VSDTGNSNLVGSPHEESGKSGTEGQFTPACHASGHTHHVLLCDETLHETFRVLLKESDRESAVLSVTVETDHLRVRLSGLQKSISVGLAG